MIKPLIYNSDIKAIEKKADSTCLTSDEAALLQQASWSESQMQQSCKNIFFSYFQENAKFIQIDNGGKMGVRMRIKKAREGTEKGMKDVLLLGSGKRIALVEFKKIGSPAEIEPKPAQRKIHNLLEGWGFPAYFCNNTIYFEKVICEEFRSYCAHRNVRSQ